MTLMMLRCFLAAMETLSFTAGAGCVHISQPAFSRNIAALEEELGFPLFVRSKHSGLRPTPAAEEYCRGLLALRGEYELLMARTGRISRGLEATVTVGIQNGVCVDSWIKNGVQTMAERYPHVELRLLCYPFRELIRSVEEGKADTCIVLSSAVRSNPNLDYTDIAAVENYLAVPARLGCDTAAVHSLAEFADETFILSEDAPELNALLIGVCRAAGFVPKTRLAPDLETRMLWIEFGQGVGVHSREHYLKSSPHVDFVKVREIGPEQYAMIRKKGSDNPTLTLLARVLQETAREQGGNTP